jgi:hypothetical protein
VQGLADLTDRHEAPERASPTSSDCSPLPSTRPTNPFRIGKACCAGWPSATFKASNTRVAFSKSLMATYQRRRMKDEDNGRTDTGPMLAKGRNLFRSSGSFQEYPKAR